jgi:hypothetical protein
MHWELTFADIFSQRGGFDLVLGNPPWLKVEWNEAGILGEAKPLFAIRKFSATELAPERAKAFDEFPRLQADWTAELEEAEATQNFLNGTQNYPLLRAESQPLQMFHAAGLDAGRATGCHRLSAPRRAV